MSVVKTWTFHEHYLNVLGGLSFSNKKATIKTNGRKSLPVLSVVIINHASDSMNM